MIDKIRKKLILWLLKDHERHVIFKSLWINRVKYSKEECPERQISNWMRNDETDCD